MTRHALLLTLLLAVGTLAACAGSPDARPASVKPGINDAYLKTTSANPWLARFEVESREIWRHRQRIADAVGLRRGLDVADVGAGTGFFSLIFARRIGSGGTLHAVEIVPAFLRRIDELARRDRLSNIRTVHCREDSVDLPEACVDLVFVCDTYHHFEYPDSTMRSIRRALRPGGELVVIDFIREEGVSRPWILDHVRAGEATVRREIEAHGFRLVERLGFLEENYFLRFVRE